MTLDNHGRLKDFIIELKNGSDVTLKEVSTDLYPQDKATNGTIVALLIAEGFEQEYYVEGLRLLGMAAILETSSQAPVTLEILVKPHMRGQGVEDALIERAKFWAQVHQRDLAVDSLKMKVLEL